MEKELAFALIGLALVVFGLFKFLVLARCPNCNRRFGFSETGKIKYHEGERFTGPLLGEMACRYCGYSEWEELTGPNSKNFLDTSLDLDGRDSHEKSGGPEHDVDTDRNGTTEEKHQKDSERL